MNDYTNTLRKILGALVYLCKAHNSGFKSIRARTCCEWFAPLFASLISSRLVLLLSNHYNLFNFTPIVDRTAPNRFCNRRRFFLLRFLYDLCSYCNHTSLEQPRFELESLTPAHMIPDRPLVLINEPRNLRQSLQELTSASSSSRKALRFQGFERLLWRQFLEQIQRISERNCLTFLPMKQ